MGEVLRLSSVIKQVVQVLEYLAERLHKLPTCIWCDYNCSLPLLIIKWLISTHTLHVLPQDPLFCTFKLWLELVDRPRLVACYGWFRHCLPGLYDHGACLYVHAHGLRHCGSERDIRFKG